MPFGEMSYLPWKLTAVDRTGEAHPPAGGSRPLVISLVGDEEIS